MDQAQKQAGPADSLSNAEKQVNKRRTHKVRRQQAYREIGDMRVHHPEDLGQESHMRFNPYW